MNQTDEIRLLENYDTQMDWFNDLKIEYRNKKKKRAVQNSTVQ